MSGTSGDASRLAELIRQYRRRAGLTQKDAAYRAAISIGSLRDLEQGRVSMPRPGTVRGLAAALSLSELEAEQLIKAAAPADSHLRVHILGPLVISVAGASVDLGSQTQRLLLGLMSLYPNTPVPRDSLIDIIWGATPPATAINLLQTHISRLRRSLEPLLERVAASSGEPIVTGLRGGYQVNLLETQLDLLIVRRLHADARRLRDEGQATASYQTYLQGLDLWRGDPLADMPSVHLHPAVVALKRDRQSLAVEFADVALELGHYEQALPHLERLTVEDPMHELAHAKLMIALAGSGQQAAALEVFDTLRRRLVDELGADPGPDVTAAHQQVLRQEVTRPQPAAVTAHRQLPPDILEFTGRGEELRYIRDGIRDAHDQVGALSLVTIAGMAGVGKTKLAVHLAHQLVAAGRYADHQLYVDLQGHSVESPADPATILGSLLRLLGMPGSQIPDDVQARSALFRDQIHGKDALVLLDNASNEEQVAPLLPAGPSNLVIVTSRRNLAVDGALAVSLDVFSPYEAEVLLTRIARRQVADKSSAERVVDLCGRLPLAIALVARRLQRRPTWDLAYLADRIRGSTHPLDEFAAGNRQLRAVFDLSYQSLDDETRRAFSLLGLHPGDGFTNSSAASLLQCSPRKAQQLIDRLLEEHLLMMVTAERYRLHDLLGEYAAEMAETFDSYEAISRVLTWYLFAAYEAGRLISPAQLSLRLDGNGKPPDVPVFSSDDQAFAWLSGEHANLMGAVECASTLGLPHLAWQLPSVLKPYFEHASLTDDWISAGKIALAGARDCNDGLGEATAQSVLALGYAKSMNLQAAIQHFERGLQLRRICGDRTGESRALNDLGLSYMHLHEYQRAAEYLQASINIRDELGEEDRKAATLGNLAWVHAEMGHFDEALKLVTEAVDIKTRLQADPYGLVITIYQLGEVLRAAGRAEEAVPHYESVAGYFHRKGYRNEEADVLEALGAAYQASGHARRAKGCWERSLAIFEATGHPMASDIRARLAEDNSVRTNVAVADIHDRDV